MNQIPVRQSNKIAYEKWNTESAVGCYLRNNEIPESLNFLWQCEDVNGIWGFGIDHGVLICPLFSHLISNG